jgi:protein-tyrosine phosphatase
VTPERIARSHLVLATDSPTLRSLQRRCTSPHAHKLHLLLDFVPDRAGQDLPLPQKGAAGDYSQMLDLCELAIVGLTKALVTGANGPAHPLSRAGAPANMGYR